MRDVDQATAPASSDPGRDAADLTVVIPTYREAPNIPRIVERLGAVRAQQRWNLDVLFMDDDSRDGSVEAVGALHRPWVRIVVRTAGRGLSAAVLDGLRLARGRVVVVMDADLSHPPERLPDMVRALDDGADMVVGSRRVPGGSTDPGWSLFRRLNSAVATLLARPLTPVRDPMSGYFALRRETLERGAPLNPVGYKIGLEILVKCGCRNVREVPIHFADRELGQSKLTPSEQWRYLRHLRRLYLHRHPVGWRVVEIGTIGLAALGLALLVSMVLRGGA